MHNILRMLTINISHNLELPKSIFAISCELNFFSFPHPPPKFGANVHTASTCTASSSGSRHRRAASSARCAARTGSSRRADEVLNVHEHFNNFGQYLPLLILCTVQHLSFGLLSFVPHFSLGTKKKTFFFFFVFVFFSHDARRKKAVRLPAGHSAPLVPQ